MHIKTKIAGALMLAVLIVPGISFAQTTSVADLQALIASLTAQLQQLQAQLAAQTGGSTATAWCYDFNSNLSVGMSGSAVTALQTALQKDGESVTVNGSFDDQTAAAVTGLQEKYASSVLAPSGLSNGTGYAGKATRTKLNTMFGCGVATSTTGTTNATMAFYQNSMYGIKFNYPSNYTVKYGNDAFGQSSPMGDYGLFAQDANATSLITVEMPASFYPGTSFSGAAFNVSVDKNLSAGQCAALKSDSSVGISNKGTQIINGVSFSWVDGGGAAAGTSYDEGSGSGYANGVCYEFATGVQYSDMAAEGTTFVPFDRTVLTSALKNIISTMSFSAPVNLPPVCPAWGCNGPEPIRIATGTVSTALSATRNSSFQAGSLIAGKVSQQIGSYIISNPSSENVNLTSLTIQPGANASLFQNFRIVVRAYAAMYSQQSVTNNTPVTFPNMSISIEPNHEATIDVYADVASTATAGLQNTTMVNSCTAMGETSNAIYNCGSAQGQTMTFTTVANSTSQVQNLVATANGTSVNLSWSAVTGVSGMWGYNVYRSTISGFTPNATNNGIASVVGGLSYTNANLTPGTYYYVVAAVDGNGNILGTPSAQVSVTVTGGGVSSNGTSLSVSSNGAFPSGSTVAGSQSQKIASYTIAAPISESVTLSQVGLTFQGSSASYVGGVLVAYNPTLAASTSGHNGTYVLTSSGGQSYQTNLPSQLNVTIAAGSSITLDFYAVNVNNVPAGSQIGTSLACAAQGNISYAMYSCGANQGQTITIASVSNPTASNLQMKADASFPGGRVVAAGTVYLGTFDLTATGGESVKILSLPTNYFIQGSNVTGGEITNLQLVNGNAQQIGATVSSLTSANTNGAVGNGIYNATFGSQNSPLNLIVPGNSTMKISILGNLSASAGGDSIQAGISGGSLGNAVGSNYNLNVPIGDTGAPTIYPTTVQ